MSRPVYWAQNICEIKMEASNYEINCAHRKSLFFKYDCERALILPSIFLIIFFEKYEDGHNMPLARGHALVT